MFKHNIKSALINPRIMAVFFLGFSSGLPLVLIGSTLQAWYTEAGVSIVTIGALSLVGTPYVWKFLWAPLMDAFSLSKNSKRRGWILLTQLLLYAALLVVATQDPKSHPVLVAMIALAIAFFSASQDVAIDAYRTDILHPDERGIGAAYFTTAYRISMLVAGGLGLVLADHLGWRVTYQLMAVIMALSTIVTYFAPEPEDDERTPKNLLAAVLESFGDLLKRESIGWILLFIVLYKFGDAFASSLITNFLLKGLGFSLTNIGIVFKTVSLIATIAGAFVGGILLVRLSLFRALLLFGLAQAFSTLTFMLLAMAGKNFTLMVISITIENFCSAMGTTAFLAYLMSLCNHRYSATQFACLSALSAVGRVFLGPFAGVMQLHWGWINFYAWSFILSFPGLLLLLYLRKKVSFNANAVPS
jgi:PAT family beta-lactamase induction signal transducer AmpG